MTEYIENTPEPLETDLPIDDVLADISQGLLDPYEESPSPAKEKVCEKQQREDRWLVTLMAIASVLCAGIIGVLIFWLNNYLK